MPKRLLVPWFALPGRCVQLLSDLKPVAVFYRTNRAMLLGRLARLYLRGGFSPREAIQNGLLDRSLPEATLAATVSKRSLVELQARVNPGDYDCLTEDKAVFYAYVAPLAFPSPD